MMELYLHSPTRELHLFRLSTQIEHVYFAVCLSGTGDEEHKSPLLLEIEARSSIPGPSHYSDRAISDPTICEMC
jgi:hypothetical protein